MFLVPIQSPRDDSLSQPAAASSLGEGAWTGAQKPPSLREVGNEADLKESATEHLHASYIPTNEKLSSSPLHDHSIGIQSYNVVCVAAKFKLD